MILYKVLESWRVTDADVADIGVLVEALSPGAEKPTESRVRDTCSKHHVVIAVDTSIERQPIVGMTTLVINHQLLGYRGYIEDVSRHPDYHGRGIGDGIMDKVHELARKNGVCKLALTCKPARNGGNQLYLRKGYKLVETNVYRIELT